MSIFNNTPENAPEGARDKLALITTSGFLAGVIVGGIVVAFFFKDALRFDIPTPEEIGVLSFPAERQIPLTETDILLPRELVTEEYYTLLNDIINGINSVAVTNNETLVPLMNAVQEKGMQGDYADLFNTILRVRGEIDMIGNALVSVQENINELERVNNKDVSNQVVHDATATFVNSGYALMGAYIDYLQTLTAMFSGQVPSQELVSQLNENIDLMTSANAQFESNLNSLLRTIKDQTTEV